MSTFDANAHGSPAREHVAGNNAAEQESGIGADARAGEKDFMHKARAVT